MKALSDFIAVILFFAAYTITKNIITATVVAVIIGIFQAAYTYWKCRKLEPMQWISLLLVVGLGMLTIVFRNRAFIMLKTTVLPWLIALVMLAMRLRGKNGLKLLMGKEIQVPEPVWNKIAYTWIVFFFLLGALNLAVAYPFTEAREAVWVQFKLWGYLPLILLFSVGQAFYLVKHLPKGEV